MSDCTDWETLVAEMSGEAKVALNIYQPDSPVEKKKEKHSLSSKVKMMRKMVSPKGETSKKKLNTFEDY